MNESKRLFYLILLVILALILSGCATRLADMTVISTRNVSLDKIDLDSLPQVQGVTGKDTKYIFLFIPLGYPHLEDAIDDALEKGGGDIMTDAIIHRRGFCFIIGENTLEVKGTVVKTRGGAK